MHTTVADLSKRLSYEEFLEWIAYDSIEPFGDARADFRNAILCKTLVSLWSSTKSEYADFIPKFYIDPEQQAKRLKAEFELIKFRQRERERGSKHNRKSKPTTNS